MYGYNLSLGKNVGRLPYGALRYAQKIGTSFVNIIGLSVSEFWDVCPVEHRTLYSADGSEWYDDATIISNIQASEFLNDGGELVGNATKGYAQYPEGTDEMILRRAYRYFGIAYPDVLPALNPDGSTMLNPDGSTAYNPA